MSDTPQEWSLKLACERAGLSYDAYTGGPFYSASSKSIRAHALTIEKHEPVPVDPVIQKAAAAFNELWLVDEYGDALSWGERLRGELEKQGLQITEASK